MNRNVDVKNSLDKVLTACDKVNQQFGGSLEDMLMDDIYVFIQGVFQTNGQQVFEDFCKTYQLKENLKNSFVEENVDIPGSVRYLCDKGLADISKVFISFFLVLGRSYMEDDCYKTKFNKSAFVDVLRRMEVYADKCTGNQKTSSFKTGDMKSKEIKKDIKTQEVAEEEQTEDSEMTQAEMPEETLEELLQQLDSLTGLADVKKEIRQIIDLVKVQNKAKELNKKFAPLSLHLVFYGNPGTGKTTVARILAKIYCRLGVLSQGQMIEVDRSKLVAGFVGQTAIKTQEVIDSALGGILFIDEAYTLTHGKGENDFGQEAVDTILKAMEDHRDDLIVIVAGYPQLMEEFLTSNPGLKSRFSNKIHFEDYLPEELVAIYKGMCETGEMVFGEGCEEYLKQYFTKMYEERKEDYANGRDVRNFYEKTIRAYSSRLAPILENISVDDFSKIELSDLKEAAEASHT